MRGVRRLNTGSERTSEAPRDGAQNDFPQTPSWFAKRCPQVAAFSAVPAICLLVARGFGAQSYSVTDLGPLVDLPGRTDSKPYAINTLGVVAGANVVGSSYQALVYSNSWVDLGTLGGGESLAAGINDSGQVVGYSATAGGTTNAFLWTPGATDGVAGNPQMKSLATLGGAVSEAYSINNSGQITGYSDVPSHPSAQQHAFLYSAGTMLDIGQQLSSLPNSYGYSVNSSGHVAGTAYDASYSAPNAFFYNGTTTVNLGLFGGLGASALVINNLDTVAGYLTTTASFDHAFTYSNGTMTDLGTLGGHYSYALGINNSNVIVGGSFSDTHDSIYHAFLLSNGAMTDLNTALDASGAGWTLIEARAINDAGHIAGIGSLGGVNHSFLLTPVLTTKRPPEITGIQNTGSNVVIRFTTVAAGAYTVQTNGTLLSNGWSNWLTSIIGNGNPMSVTNSAALGSSARFYRVLLSAP